MPQDPPQNAQASEPAYPAELLDDLAQALAACAEYDPIGRPRQDRARQALDRYSAEVGRENVPRIVSQAIATLVS